MEDKLLDLSKIITYQLSKRVKLNKDEMEIIAYQLRIIISEVYVFCDLLGFGKMLTIF